MHSLLMKVISVWNVDSVQFWYTRFFVFFKLTLLLSTEFYLYNMSLTVMSNFSKYTSLILLQPQVITVWVAKKIKEFIGEEEPTLVDFICNSVWNKSSPQYVFFLQFLYVLCYVFFFFFQISFSEEVTITIYSFIICQYFW